MNTTPVISTRRKIAPLHLESVADIDSVIGPVHGDHYHRLSLKSPSVNAKTVLGFHSDSLINSVAWQPP
jgi:hypothetical protein